MSRVEQRLALAPKEEEPDGQVILEEERHQLLALTEQLAEPELSPQARLSLVAVLRVLLSGASLTGEYRWNSTRLVLM